jgi:hypothetical protein
MNNKEYFQKGLCDISELKTGWISGAPAIHQNIIDITQKLINELTDTDLENWSISPFVNGSIILSYNYEDKRIVINIAQNEMTYTFYKTGSIGECGKHTFNTGNIHMDDAYSKMKYLIKNAKTLHY